MHCWNINGTYSHFSCTSCWVFATRSGLGESSSTHDRLLLIAYGYQQAAAVTMAAAAEWMERSTGSCTTIDDHLSIVGASEGGYGAVMAGLTMQGLGWNVSHVHSNAGPLDPDIQISFFISSISQGLLNPESSNYLLRYILPYLMFTFSNDFPGLANTGSGQIGLSPPYTVEGNLSRNVLEWFRSPDPLTMAEIISFGPTNADDLLDLLNPNLVQLYISSAAQNVTETCAPENSMITEGSTDLLCQAIHEASLWPAIRSLSFPLQLCFSPNDALVPTSMFPPELFENELVARFEEVFSGISLPIDGDHWHATNVY
jgi:hypothetical protein